MDTWLNRVASGKTFKRPVTPEISKSLPLASKPVLALNGGPETSGKEPWQMTKKEFQIAENKPRLEAIHKAIEEGKPIVLRTHLRITPLKKKEYVRMASDGTLQIPEGRKWVYLIDEQAESLAAQAGLKPIPFGEKTYHYTAVKDAIEAGKPVSPEVLKDYPDLINAPSDNEVEVETPIITEKYRKPRIKKVKVKKPEAPIQIPAFSLTAIEKREEDRSNRSVLMDISKDNSNVISKSSPKTAKWMKRPGSMDIQGVDTKLPEEQRKRIRAELHARALALKTTPGTIKGSNLHKIHKPPSTQLGVKVKKLKSGGITRRIRTGKIIR